LIDRLIDHSVGLLSGLQVHGSMSHRPRHVSVYSDADNDWDC